MSEYISLSIHKGGIYVNNATVSAKITNQEKRLCDLIRTVGHGELRVIIQDNKPIRVEELKKSIKL